MSCGSHARARPRGITLIETMISLSILSVGLMGLGTLLMGSIASNNRNAIDTTGTFVAQMVMEQIAAKPLNTSFTLQDCNPAGATTWTITTTAAGSPGAGAPLDSNGNIDFTQTYASLVTAWPNYEMQYVSCGANNTQATFDVRWNVRVLTTTTSQVTVAARQIAVSSNGMQLPYFAPPVTLKTVIGW